MSGLKRANNPGYAVFSGFFIVYLSFVVYKQRTQPLQNCAPTKAGDASFLSPFGAHFMCQVSSSALTPSFCGRIKCSHFVQRLFISGTFLPLYHIYSIYKVWLYRLAYQQIKVIIRYQIMLMLMFFFLIFAWVNVHSPDFVIIIPATVSTTLFAFWRPSAFSSSQLDLPPHFSTPLLWLLCFFLRLMGSNCRSDSEIGVQIENRKTGSKKKIQNKSRIESTSMKFQVKRRHCMQFMALLWIGKLEKILVILLEQQQSIDLPSWGRKI